MLDPNEPNTQFGTPFVPRAFNSKKPKGFKKVWHRLRSLSLELKILLPIIIIALIMIPISVRTASRPTETGSRASESTGAPLGGGTEYFLSPTGTVNTQCTQSNPCDSIETVLNVPQIGAQPGDTVVALSGTYHGQQKIINKHFDNPVLIRAAEPYKSILQNNGVVLTIRNGYNIALKDFEMRQVEPVPNCNTGTTSAYIIQLSDSSDPNGPFGALRGPDNGYYDSQSHFYANGTDFSGEITIENNIIHDSFCEDHIKLQNGGNIRIIGNMFYNQATRNNQAGNHANGGTPEEFLDLNSVFNVQVSKNIFFNEFSHPGEPGAFIVVKDSGMGVPDGNTRFGLTNQNGEVVVPYPNENNFSVNTSPSNPGNRTNTCNPAGSNCDTIIGSNAITIDKNIFFNYSNTSHQYPLLQFGAEDTLMYILNHGVVENNLFIGNTGSITRATFELEAVRYFTFRNNTITGNLPSRYYGYRWKTQDSVQRFANSDITIANNVWSDPTGSMGVEDGTPEFARAEAETITAARLIRNNLFWNANNPIPLNQLFFAQYTEDQQHVVTDPGLGDPANIRTPIWNGSVFRSVVDGDSPYQTISQARTALVRAFGTPSAGVIDRGSPELAAATDILGTPRTGIPDIGALETNPVLPSPSPSPITSPSQLPSPNSSSEIKFNFQPENSDIPGGYVPDTGEQFGRRHGYRFGWNQDISTATRERNSSESLLRNTLIHMQIDGSFRWEVQLPNGIYQVSVMAGDPNFTDSLNSLRVENQIVLDDGEDNFDYYTVDVQITDGRLTIRPAPNAENAKLNYVIITPK